MKKIVLKKMIYLFVFLFSLTLVFAQQNQHSWSAEVLPICDGVCLEGNEALWLVELNNIGETSIRFSEIYLIDDDDIPFGYIDLSQEEAIVPPHQSGTVYVEGVVPPPSRSSTLFYKLNYVVDGEVYPDMMFRNMNVMKQSDIECLSNDSCETNEICAGYRCMPYSLFNQSEVPRPPKQITSDTIQIILLSIAVVLLMIIVYFNITNKKKNKK